MSQSTHASPPWSCCLGMRRPVELEEEGEEKDSPVRYGVLAAALVHLANVFISSLTSGLPWAVIHGVANSLISILLLYMFFTWRSRFNSSLYLRREIRRLSAVMGSVILGTLVAHSTIAANDGGATKSRCVPSAFGCVRLAAAWVPAVYAVILLLWVAFWYVQNVAIVNIEGLGDQTGKQGIDHWAVPAGDCTTLRQVRPQVHHTWYVATLIAAAGATWCMGFLSWGGNYLGATVCTISTLLFALPAVSIKWRASKLSVILLYILTLLGLLCISLAASPLHTGKAKKATAVTVAIILFTLQVLVAVISFVHHREWGGQEEAESAESPFHFFKKNAATAETKEIDVFLAAVDGAAAV